MLGALKSASGAWCNRTLGIVWIQLTWWYSWLKSLAWRGRTFPTSMSIKGIWYVCEIPINPQPPRQVNTYMPIRRKHLRSYFYGTFLFRKEGQGRAGLNGHVAFNWIIFTPPWQTWILYSLFLLPVLLSALGPALPDQASWLRLLVCSCMPSFSLETLLPAYPSLFKLFPLLHL